MPCVSLTTIRLWSSSIWPKRNKYMRKSIGIYNLFVVCVLCLFLNWFRPLSHSCSQSKPNQLKFNTLLHIHNLKRNKRSIQFYFVEFRYQKIETFVSLSLSLCVYECEYFVFVWAALKLWYQQFSPVQRWAFVWRLSNIADVHCLSCVRNMCVWNKESNQTRIG